jgi:hypothetical protein
MYIASKYHTQNMNGFRLDMVIKRILGCTVTVHILYIPVISVCVFPRLRLLWAQHVSFQCTCTLSTRNVTQYKTIT